MYTYIHLHIYIYIYIYILKHNVFQRRRYSPECFWGRVNRQSLTVSKQRPTRQWHTPGLHNKIPAHKIFARVWVAQEPICLHYRR